MLVPSHFCPHCKCHSLLSYQCQQPSCICFHTFSHAQTKIWTDRRTYLYIFLFCLFTQITLYWKDFSVILTNTPDIPLLILIIKHRYILHSDETLLRQRKTIKRVCNLIQPLNSHVNFGSLFFLDFSRNTIVYPEK